MSQRHQALVGHLFRMLADQAVVIASVAPVAYLPNALKGHLPQKQKPFSTTQSWLSSTAWPSNHCWTRDKEKVQERI